MLEASLRPERFGAGERLFSQGDVADALYLIEEGNVAVARNGETIATLDPGSFAGEMGLLTDERRSADLVAITEVAVLVLDRSALDDLLADHPDVALELSRQLSFRLATTTSRLSPSASRLVVAAWASSDLDRFVAALGAVTGECPTVVPAGEPLPAGGAEPIVALLPSVSGRAARTVLRAASHVVCFDRPPEWVTGRHPISNVLRCDLKVSVERAARSVAGRAVGLAMSSGGSKTVAHVGVAHALRSAGVTIDAVSGSSGGSLVALALGAGLPFEQMRGHLFDLAEVLTIRRWDMNVPPRTGVIKGRRLRDAVDRWFEGRTFDDLAIPTAVVATDLSSGREVIIDSGPVADAVRASIAIPGVFDPWMVGGRVMIDGAVVDPLPVHCLRDRGASFIIASNVAGKALDEGDGTPALAPGVVPGVMQTILRMVNLMERELLTGLLPLADVVIRPRVQASFSFDFSRIDEFVAAGEAAANDVLASLGRDHRILFPQPAGEAGQ